MTANKPTAADPKPGRNPGYAEDAPKTRTDAQQAVCDAAEADDDGDPQHDADATPTP